MSGFALTAAVNDQTAVVETVQADTRATAASREPGELLDRRFGHAGQTEDRPGDGEAELSPDSQANMLGRRLLDSDAGRRQDRAGFEHSHSKLGDDLFDSRRERALDDPGRCRLDRELDARRVDHEADAAELAQVVAGPSPEGRSAGDSASGCAGEGSS